MVVAIQFKFAVTLHTYTKLEKTTRGVITTSKMFLFIAFMIVVVSDTRSRVPSLVLVA